MHIFQGLAQMSISALLHAPPVGPVNRMQLKEENVLQLATPQSSLWVGVFFLSPSCLLLSFPQCFIAYCMQCGHLVPAGLFWFHFSDTERYFVCIRELSWECRRYFLVCGCPCWTAQLSPRWEICPVIRNLWRCSLHKICYQLNWPLSLSLWNLGSSYLEWFVSYVNNVVTGGYPIIRDQIFR